MMKRGLLTVFVFALLFGLSSGSSAQAKSSCRRDPRLPRPRSTGSSSRGQTVNVLFSNHPWQEAVAAFHSGVREAEPG